MSFKATVIGLAIGVTIGGGAIVGYNFFSDAKSEQEHIKKIEQMKNNESEMDIVIESLQSNLNSESYFPTSISTATFEEYVVHKEGKKSLKNIFNGEAVKFKGKEVLLKDPTVSIFAQTDASFEHGVYASEIKIKYDKDTNTLKVVSPYPHLNKESISVKHDTFKEIDKDGKKSDMNADAMQMDLMSNAGHKNVTNSIRANAVNAYFIKYEKDAPKNIEKLYTSNKEKIQELEDNTIASTHKFVENLLLKTLNSLEIAKDVTIEVELEKTLL